MTRSKDVSRRELMVATAALAAAAGGAGAHAQETHKGETPQPAEAGQPDLSGKSILITGASSGFGRLGAEHYARLGAKVFATMRNMPRPEAEALRDVASKDGLDIEVVEIDVLSDESVAGGVSKALAANDGQLDVLINNAGIAITGAREVQDMQATQLAFDTNVFGYQRMIQAVLPAMRAVGSGQIFAVSSQLGRVIIPGAGHYSATKFAVEAMAEQLAYELVPHGIDVTIIQPGGYPTNIWANRNRYSAALKERTDEALLAAYGPISAGMVTEDGGNQTTDPMDIPRAIAEIIAMPAGTRPLRRAVHPVFRPQEPVNVAQAEAQLAFLGESPFGPWIKAALD